ncbi:MAG: phosphoribosylaminoimidazolesuccinocarboxamide synthase [Desulfovibrionaceae bacterium]|nr:phosphoribosylaminoimidazolesuccinocarboxamide synthase [Desulfovibrionaceae bacterium]
MKIVTSTNIEACKLLSRGKVRDIYAVDDETLLIVTTDRMSAYDFMMSRPIPYKGVVLNQITLFWMDMFKDIIPNHIIESDTAKFPAQLAPYKDDLEGRAVLVRKAKPLPIECIVRGYISGSGWKSYQKNGTVCGHVLPAGLKESDKLDKAIFTPSTKAEFGQHDENISVAQASDLMGRELTDKVEEMSLAIYEKGRAYAASRGILVADTKFEFGLIGDTLYLIDEVLTPDSSRFWPADSYEPGHSQPSFDKQFLRDWLTSTTWDMKSEPPALTDEVVETTAARYQEAYRILTGCDLGLK